MEIIGCSPLVVGIILLYIDAIVGGLGGLLVEVDKHHDSLFVPDESEKMEFAVLEGVGFGGLLSVGCVGPFRAPMAGAVEESVGGAVGDPFLMSHLEDIGLATAGPSDHIIIVAHHPESGPEAVGGSGEFDRGFDLAMLEGHKIFGIDASGGEVSSAIILSSGGGDEASVALAVVADTHIFGSVAVELEFVVAPASAVDLDVPTVGTQLVAVEKILPDEVVSARLAGAGLGLGGRGGGCGQ